MLSLLRSGYKSVFGCTWARPDRRPIDSHASGPTTGTKIVTSAQIMACAEVRRLAVRAIETSATTVRAMTRTENKVHAMSYPTGMIGLMELLMSSAYGEGSAGGNGTGGNGQALCYAWAARKPNPQRALTPESLFTGEGSWLLQDAGRNPVMHGVQALNAAVESRVVRPGQAGPKAVVVWRL